MGVLASGVAVVAALAVAAGAAPRLGPARATALGVSTWKYYPLKPAIADSKRESEMATLRHLVGSLKPDRYIVVRGPKGVGKSRLVEAALAGLPGVVSVDVHPGAKAAEIEKDAYKAIARYKVDFLDPTASAERVIFYHRLIFGQAPIVVLCVGEVPAGQKHASVGNAVRNMAKRGLRVVIDSSDSSLEEMAVMTIREKVIEIDEMPREMLESIPEFKQLLERLKKAGLSDLTWAVLGGNPAKYAALDEHVQQPSMSFKEATEQFLWRQLLDAATTRRTTVAANNHMARIYAMFKEAEEVPERMLGEDIKQPSPDKVLRLLVKPGTPEVKVLRPASAAMRLVLRYGEGVEAPSLDKVRTELAREAAQGTRRTGMQ